MNRKSVLKKHNNKKTMLKIVFLAAMIILGFSKFILHSHKQYADTSGDWRLILVDKNHYIPKDYQMNLTRLSNGKQVDSRIEGAAYYSLRQVCMARILLFGFMDLLIVTAFAVSVAFTVRISAQMFAVNFLIPFNVTGAICFRFLYCKRSESEYLAAAGCFLFMILWVFIISREEIYCKISGTVWCVALILSIIYLIYVVKRSQSFYGEMYEVQG